MVQLATPPYLRPTLSDKILLVPEMLDPNLSLKVVALVVPAVIEWTSIMFL